MSDKKKHIALGRLVDEYLVKVKAGEKISINDWAELHKKEAPKEELKEQLRMGVLLTKVGETARPKPELTEQQRARIKANVLKYYDEESPKWPEAQSANEYLSDAADTFGKGDYAKTKELLNKAMPIHQKHGNFAWLGFEYSIFGVIAILEDNFDSAIENFHKSDGLYQKTGETKARVGVLGHLGMLYFTQNKFDQSEKAYKETLKLAEEINLPGAIMTALNNLGLIELAWGKNLAGFELFQKTLVMAQAQNDKETQAIAYGNMAEASENGRAHKTAIELYHKSLTLSREGKYYRLIAQSAARLGALYASHNKLDEASQLFNEAANAVDQLRGASTEPTAVKFRRSLGSFGMPSTEEVLTDFRRRIKEEQMVTA
ncbi:MAG TPA: tetratricopeptide repeat protein [Planctomycetota bacterium]|nr:tetratricopeptide repeat protein [Planctomycetota bacterium]